jgi:hypothetical protein
MTRKLPSSGGQSGATTEPFAAAAAQDTAKLALFRSALSRARFNKSIGKLAEKEFATKDRRVKAAYDEAKMQLTNAWRKSSEFQTALHFAVTLKIMEPLAKLLESKTPMTRSDRLTLASFVRSLEAPKEGRPPGRLSDDLNVAQRNAVYLVWHCQKDWLIKNNRQRVPGSVTNELIAYAINVATKDFPLSPKLSSDDIRARVNKTSRNIID